MSATLYTPTKCGHSVCTRPGKCAQQRWTSHCTQACFLRLSCFVFLYFSSSRIVCDGWNYGFLSMRSSPVNSRSPCVLCKRVRKHMVVVEGTVRNLRYLEHSSDMSLWAGLICRVLSWLGVRSWARYSCDNGSNLTCSLEERADAALSRSHFLLV